MKKSAAILGSILTVAVLGGGFYAFKGEGNAVTAAYWDGKTELNQKAADGSLPLIKAVKAKDRAAVGMLLAKGADADAADKDGVTAVMEALKSGQAELFAELAAVSKADFKEPAYMMAAIDSGNAALVSELLKKGADVNAVLEFKGRKRPEDVLNYKDQRVMTPLKKAVQENKPEIAAVLAANGAEGVADFLGEQLRTATPEMVLALAKNAGNLRKIAVKGMDLLTYAAGEAHPEVTAYLLKENAGDMNKALMRVLTQRSITQPFEETVDTFIKAGATPSAEALEMMLKKKKDTMFIKLAGCYADPNVTPEGLGEDVFMYAVRNGRMEIVAWLLEHGADIWKESAAGATPLKVAAMFAKDRPELMALFEKQIKDVNDTGYNGETLLMLSAASGNLSEFQRFVNKGGNIWQKDNDGKTVLMYAAEGGNTAILDHLLYKGDNPAAVDKHGKTALMYAAAAGQDKAVKYLADRGAEISAVDDDGKAAIMYAAEKGHHEIVEMLVNMGESAAVTDKKGKTALMYAAEGGSLPAVETLLMKGVDVNAVDENGVPVLSYAVKGNNSDVARRLVRQGANVLAQDSNGYLPLMFALLKGNEAMFRAVSPGGMEYRKQAKSDGMTVGIMAVLGGNVDLIERMLNEARETLNVADNEGRTFMMMLAGEGRPEAMRQGINRHGDVKLRDKQGRTALMYAAEKSVGVNLIALLKASQEEINAADNEGRTALMYALGYKENQPVKMHILLTNGADAKAADKNGKTVLMYAAGNSYNTVSGKALDEIAARAGNVEVKDNGGRTALMYAAANPNVSSDGVQSLLNAGAKADAQDNNGKTVLMYAAESGDMGKLQLLLKNGAKADAKTNDGKTVKDFLNQNTLCFKRAAEEMLK